MGAWAQTRVAARGSKDPRLNRFVDKESSFKSFLNYGRMPILRSRYDFRMSP